MPRGATRPKYEDTFGYLPHWIAIEFDRGVIFPLLDFRERTSEVKRITYSDGYVYPPILPPSAGRNRGRPAALFKLPATHGIAFTRASADHQRMREGASGLVINLLALIFGGRYQFGDWWFDGRVETANRPEYENLPESRVASCINAALREWSKWGRKQQRRAIIALHLYGRSDVHERESDRFEAEYQIADAVFALAKSTGKLSISANARLPHHAFRLKMLCRDLALARDAKRIENLVRLRNPLLHEAVWDKGTPGAPRGDTSFYAAYWLHRLSRRALLAVFGLEGSFLRSPWWQLGTPYFDVSGPG